MTGLICSHDGCGKPLTVYVEGDGENPPVGMRSRSLSVPINLPATLSRRSWNRLLAADGVMANRECGSR